jgi:hypothetical protein
VKRLLPFLCLLPVAVGLACLAPVLGHGFAFDDERLIVSNPYVHDFGHLWENLTRD